MSQLLDPERKLSFYFQEMLNTYTESIQNRLKNVQAKAQGTLEELERQTAGITPQLSGEEIADYIRETLVPLRAEQEATVQWHSRLLVDLDRITRGTEQKQILEAVLEATAGIAERAFILLVRQGQVSGWEGRGYPASFVETGLKTFATAADADAVIGPLLAETGGQTFTRDSIPAGARYLEIDDFDRPDKFYLFPLVLFGSVAAVLFIDGDGCRVGDAEAIQAGETIMTSSAIWLENLAMRKSLGLGLPGEGPVIAEPEAGIHAAAFPAVIEEPPTAKTSQAAEEVAELIEAPMEEHLEEPAAEPVAEPIRAPWESPAAAPAVDLDMPVDIPAAPDTSASVTREFPAEEQAVELDLAGIAAGPETDEDEIRLEEPPAAPETPVFGQEPTLIDQVMMIESMGEEEILVDEAAAAPVSPSMFEAEPEEIVLEEPVDMGYAPSMDLATGPAVPTAEEPEEIVLEEHPLEELILEETPAAPSFEAPAPVMSPPPIPAAPPVSAQPWSTPDEEKQYNDARRFARLLVSEIKLYNEDSVTEGRIEKDLYRRLQKDIDRSREMFDKRVPRSLGLKIDYFHEELVRILAEGDSTKLGKGYPGPVNQ